jgi:hypothetical protein
MKTKHVIYVLLLMAFTLSSCREITITTRVNNDGSFTRIVIITGDSTEVLAMDLPYPIDSTWKREFFRDTADSARYICSYTKLYHDDDVLNNEIQQDTSWKKQIERKIEVSKRFMFFYSFLSYREVYKAANPCKLLNYRDYLSSDDVQWISGNKIPLNEPDSIKKDNAESKVELYIHDVLTEEIMLAISEGINRLDKPELQTIDVSFYKDSIADKALDWASGSLDKFIDALLGWTGNPAVAELKSLDPPIFENLEKKIDFFDKLIMMEAYKTEVEMPGLITETNSSVLMGNMLSWNIESLSFFFEDYEMYVESRVVNYWAFVVSGLLVLLLLLTLVIKVFK